MTTRTMRYPGDRPVVVVDMTGAEFLALRGPGAITVTTFRRGVAEHVETTPVPDVRCDLCGEPVADDERCWLAGGRYLYCDECSTTHVQPYLA